MNVRIAVLPGDGIGPEVVSAARTEVPEGWEVVDVAACADRYLASGILLDDAEIATIADCDAVLFGAIGDPRVPDGVLERGILLRLRRELDLYVNLRPFDDIGVVIVRENTEGPYGGMGRTLDGTAIEMNVNTRVAVERCARFACELATERRGIVTLVHKSNVMIHAGSLWRDAVFSVAEMYDVTVRYEHIDAAAYHLITDPSRFDVLLTDNLFGDVLSDVAAGVAGGLGRAASANLHPEPATRPARCIGLFEPVHGSAPDLAGRSVADPAGAIEAARMMVRILTEEVTARS